MPRVSMFKKILRAAGIERVSCERIEVSRVVNAHIIRQMPGNFSWEWRAEVEMHGTRFPIFGFSSKMEAQPKVWYPTHDAVPLTTNLTANEAREEALMAVRGAMWEAKKNPDEAGSTEALILLAQVVYADPDVIWSDWYYEIAMRPDSQELRLFAQEWEQSANINGAINGFTSSMLQELKPVTVVSRIN